MSEHTFDFDASDEVGMVVDNLRIPGGFSGAFDVEFDYDMPPRITEIRLDGHDYRGTRLVLSPGHGFTHIATLFKQIERSLREAFEHRIDEAWQQECSARAHREEVSAIAYHRWQVL